MEGSSGLTKREQLEDGTGVKNSTLDVKAVVGAIRPLANKIYIWDFDGDENNLSQVFGLKTKVISYPKFAYLKGLKISRVFLMGFHAMAGTKNEFIPHTYSSHDIEEVKINGEKVGEVTLFTHLFAQLKIPVAFVSGSYYACQEMIKLGLDPQSVAVRKNLKVYPVEKVRQEMATKAKQAMTIATKIICFRNYKMEVVFKEKISKFFKDGHFVIKSPKKIWGSSPRFEILYLDLVNGIFKFWGDKHRF